MTPRALAACFVAAVLCGCAAIPIELVKPDGAGPFPAVVLLHDCSGRGATTAGNAAAWADSIREVTAFFGRYLKATAVPLPR